MPCWLLTLILLTDKIKIWFMMIITCNHGCNHDDIDVTVIRRHAPVCPCSSQHVASGSFMQHRNHFCIMSYVQQNCCMPSIWHAAVTSFASKTTCSKGIKWILCSIHGMLLCWKGQLAYKSVSSCPQLMEAQLQVRMINIKYVQRLLRAWLKCDIRTSPHCTVSARKPCPATTRRHRAA